MNVFIKNGFDNLADKFIHLVYLILFNFIILFYLIFFNILIFNYFNIFFNIF